MGREEAWGMRRCTLALRAPGDVGFCGCEDRYWLFNWLVRFEIFNVLSNVCK